MAAVAVAGVAAFVVADAVIAVALAIGAPSPAQAVSGQCFVVQAALELALELQAVQRLGVALALFARVVFGLGCPDQSVLAQAVLAQAVLAQPVLVPVAFVPVDLARMERV